MGALGWMVDGSLTPPPSLTVRPVELTIPSVTELGQPQEVADGYCGLADVHLGRVGERRGASLPSLRTRTTAMSSGG
jgi:hypothetical protein